jgi:hypothetical protein
VLFCFLPILIDDVTHEPWAKEMPREPLAAAAFVAVAMATDQ